MSTVKRTKRGKSADASITIAEFKQWLAGVEDMQDDGWVPDAVQWAKIRAKVELLTEEEVQVVETQQYTAPAYLQPVHQQYVPAYQPQSRNFQPPAMLEGDGIVIPQQSAFDVQLDHPSAGPMHDANQFG